MLVDMGNKECFVIMPFSDKSHPDDNKWDDLFENCIKRAVEEGGLGYVCVRSVNPHGNFMHDIVEHLASAEIVIAVLTELRPNVMYELGVRNTLKRKTIMLAERGSEIPSDLSAYIALFYTNSTRGQEELVKIIRDRLASLNAIEPMSDNPVSDYLSNKAESISDDWYKKQDPQTLLSQLSEILPSYAIKLRLILNEASQGIHQLQIPSVLSQYMSDYVIPYTQHDLRAEQLNITGTNRFSIIEYIYDSLSEGSEVVCTDYLDFNIGFFRTYWPTEGMRTLEINHKASIRGIEIKRLFILAEEQIKTFEDIIVRLLKLHILAGISPMVVACERLPEECQSAEFAWFDNKFLEEVRYDFRSEKVIDRRIHWSSHKLRSFREKLSQIELLRDRRWDGFDCHKATNFAEVKDFAVVLFDFLQSP